MFFQKASLVTLISGALFIPALAFSQLPQRPQEAQHPSSPAYSYDVSKQTLKFQGRKVELYLPLGKVKQLVPTVVFGHGQAIDASGYEMSFEHMARKGIAVIHPQYDSGFFDQNWERMADDFNSLTQSALAAYPEMLSPNMLIYAGHSKGGYVALMAAGAPNANIHPKSIVLIAPADFNSSYLKNLDAKTPLNIIWGEKDTVIKKDKMLEIYNQAPSIYKQYIEVKSYPELEADHFFPLNKSYFFGGRNGISALHHYGVWKWLIGAAWDVEQKSPISNSYIFGDLTASTGVDGLNHHVQKSW